MRTVWWKWLLVPWALIGAVPIWLLYLLPLWVLGFVWWSGSLTPLVARFETRADAPDWYLRRWCGWAGTSLPFAVVLHGRIAKSTIRHEYLHTEWWLYLGPLFLPLYGALLLAYGYDDHPFERAARRAE